MIYFVYGNQSPMIRKRIKTIVKESLSVVDEMSYSRFDMADNLVQDIVDEANYLPLGYDKKVVLMENCLFLTKSKTKSKTDGDNDFESLKNYISSPNPSTDLIISVVSDEVDDKNEIVVLLKEKARTFVASTPDKDNWKVYVKKYFNGPLNTQIDNDAINEIAHRCEGDVALFENNAKKLALYTNHVTYSDVCKLVPEPLDDNAFQLYNYLINSRNDEAIRLFKDLMSQGVEPVTLISMLSNQFRLLNQVSFLSLKGMSNEEIASELNIKPVRAQIIKKQISVISESTIIKTLEDLFNLDVNIKSGLVDRFYAFELFLINFKAE